MTTNTLDDSVTYREKPPTVLADSDNGNERDLAGAEARCAFTKRKRL